MEPTAVIIKQEEFEEYKKLKEIFEESTTFRYNFYNMRECITSIGTTQHWKTPNPYSDLIIIDVKDTNNVSHAIKNELEIWLKKYEKQHDEIIKEIDSKIEYLHKNDKDMHIPSKNVKLWNGEYEKRQPNNEFRFSFIEYIKGLTKFTW